jgi:hypothetical protein
VALQLAVDALIDPVAVAVAIVACVALVRGVAAPWLILAGALIGVGRFAAGGG